ncbi:MAG TPA: hypothetical protein EYG86_04200 [Crocinitomicaceae bacterium]|nr:hypothetical protein [Crocinitomicaceae bacterium]
MKLENIYLQPNSQLSAHLSEWASRIGVQVNDHEFQMGDQIVDGLLLINENQDIDKDIYAIHSYFDERHLPTQKIDINGTLQVAISNFEMWLKNFKCKSIFIIGSEELIKNDNLDRFLVKVEERF